MQRTYQTGATIMLGALFMMVLLLISAVVLVEEVHILQGGEVKHVQIMADHLADHPNVAIPAAVSPGDERSDISWNLEQFEEEADFSVFPLKEVLATGYTAGYESTGKQPGHPQYGITYSGSKVRRDLYSTIAADIDVFPLGTILYIPGYGFGVVADTGSAIKGEHIDLYFETVQDVYERWGKRNVHVYVLKEGDGHVSDDLLEDLNNFRYPDALPVMRKQTDVKTPL